MNARKVTMIAAVLSFGLFTLEESALAQEERGIAQSQDFRCQKVRGDVDEFFPGTGNVATGVISHAGRLNGTERYVFDTDAFPTPDPNAVTFGAALTITTTHEVVELRVMVLFNLVTGIWTQIATIDPNTSTGRFAGATGTLWYPNGTTINLAGGAQTYMADLTGQVCFATRRDNGDQSK